jgi:hypothetical protein
MGRRMILKGKEKEEKVDKKKKRGADTAGREDN